MGLRIRGKNRTDAEKALYNLARESFPAPGDKSFVLGGYFPNPESAAAKERWVTYFKQLREEVSPRLLDRVFRNPEADGTPNKYWMQFALHPFMGLWFERPDKLGHATR